ncbi:hypothetical protein V9T40_004590 [Parthenolecanium corni]|uniref:Uncharacterized protein n=1 Tax=Parthenolecanium corni TaxID=536013 RepID=A0AAN9TV82_9HEMI
MCDEAGVVGGWEEGGAETRFKRKLKVTRPALAAKATENGSASAFRRYTRNYTRILDRRRDRLFGAKRDEERRGGQTRGDIEKPKFGAHRGRDRSLASIAFSPSHSRGRVGALFFYAALPVACVISDGLRGCRQSATRK